MEEKAEVAQHYLIICELCELCEQMPSVYFLRKVSMVSGKVARGIVVVKLILRILINFVPAFAYIKKCLYLCRRKQYHEATFHNGIGFLTPAERFRQPTIRCYI